MKTLQQMAESFSLADLPSLQVRQIKEWGEILTGYEQRNKYAVKLPESETPLMLAVEEGGGFRETVLRLWLRAKRPFRMNLMDAAGTPMMRLSRPFRFFFDRLEIADASGRRMGAVQKRWAWFNRIYDLEDGSGRNLLRLTGPFFRPWTFTIERNGREAGQMQKKWSGLGKELLTDTDNFFLRFSPLLGLEERLLLLGAVFLIDFVHFESRN